MSQVEQRIQVLVDDFLERLQAGEDPDPYEYLSANPQLAPQLAARLEVIQELHELAETRHAEELPLSRIMPVAIGRYQILGYLGRGGSALVYRAHDPKFARDVALKVIRTDESAPSDMVARFQRDARIAAQLRHPNIVPLHETGEDDGLHYIDMELVRGQSLEARLHDLGGKPMDPRQAAELVQKIAAALHYAHESDIVHRDIKPSNILIDERGEPQIADFGLARRLTGEESLTAHGQILGTPAYMPPEQAAGQAHTATAQSDIYSLGMVLYRMLAGRLPWTQSDSLKLLALIAHATPARPREVNPAMPRDLEIICLKAIEKDPADRFATAGSLADELWRWLHDEPLRVRPPSRWERARRWARRRRLLARTLGGVGVFFTAVCAALGWLAWQQHTKAYEANLRHSIEAKGRAEVEAWALLDKARKRLRQPTQGRRDETQEILRKFAEPRRKIDDPDVVENLDLEARSIFAASLAEPEIRVIQKAPIGNDFVFNMVWQAAIHPSGDSLVIGTHAGPIRWIRGEALQLPTGLDVKKPRARVAYSPDGKYLALAGAAGGLELWDEQVRCMLARLRAPQSSPVLAVGFDRDVKTIRTYCADGRILSWSLPEYSLKAQIRIPVESERTTHAPIGAILSVAAFNADATRLAVADQVGRIHLHDKSGKHIGDVAPSETSPVHALAWSPDSRLIALGTKDGSVQLWRAEPSTLLHQWPAFVPEVNAIQFGPDGHWIMAGSRKASVIWDVATGEQFLTGSGSVPWGFSRDGRWLAAASMKEVYFCELVRPQGMFHLRGHQAHIVQVAWSRDKRHLVSLDNRFEVRVWDVKAGLAVDAFRPPAGDFYAGSAAVALSDDGRLVAYASGGTNAVALIRDIHQTKDVAEWKLPMGYDKLVSGGKRKFLLVREEMVSQDKRALQTVIRKLEPGQSPAVVRILRQAAVTDVSGFFRAGLTPDGRYHWWMGPRRPHETSRIEVRELQSGKLLLRVPAPTANEEEGNVDLSSDGRYLIGAPETETTAELGERAIASLSATQHPRSSSYDSRWSMVVEDRGPHQASSLLLRDQWKGANRIRLPGDGIGQPETRVFSFDSQWLAWDNGVGTITLAQLPILDKVLGQFDEGLSAK